MLTQALRVGGRADFVFELRGAPVRLAQARVFVHFEMQLDEEMPIELVRR